MAHTGRTGNSSDVLRLFGESGAGDTTSLERFLTGDSLTLMVFSTSLTQLRLRTSFATVFLCETRERTQLSLENFDVAGTYPKAFPISEILIKCFNISTSSSQRLWSKSTLSKIAVLRENFEFRIERTSSFSFFTPLTVGVLIRIFCLTFLIAFLIESSLFAAISS